MPERTRQYNVYGHFAFRESQRQEISYESALEHLARSLEASDPNQAALVRNSQGYASPDSCHRFSAEEFQSFIDRSLINSLTAD